MVSKKTLGGILAGAAVTFGGILWYTISSLTGQAQVMHCVADSPACQQVVTGMSASHVAVGIVSAVFSLGLYFLFFYKDQTAAILEDQARRRSREEQIALLTKVMTPGEKAVLEAVLNEEGIMQSTLSYRTNLTPGRVSQVISDFETSGLLTKKPEGRSYRIYLQF